eukprot:6676284-Prorocentrum_lima.AAC.1
MSKLYTTIRPMETPNGRNLSNHQENGGRYASDQIALKSTICQERRHGQVMAGPENAPRVPTTCLCYTLAVLDPAACQGGGTK